MKNFSKIFLSKNFNSINSIKKTKIFSNKISISNFSTYDNNINYDPLNDYYKFLDISETANSKEIKNKYYKLSLENHPDKGGS